MFWIILFTTVNGVFLKDFGADALFLAPEYLGDVNAISAALMGISIGVFIMCWNITTFILFSRHFTFLAATQYPFVKYCINNSVIPIVFLIFYLVKGYEFAHYKELIGNGSIVLLAVGFLLGLLLILALSFSYFFNADKTILRKLKPLFDEAKDYIAQLQPDKPPSGSLLHTEYFLDSFVSFRRCRDVSHYSVQLMETIFKRHHFAAAASVLIAIGFLIITGYFLEYRLFQIPAGASITLFFAILIGVSGAVTYFLQSWSVPFMVVCILLLNFFYRLNWLDPKNKAYGLSYRNSKQWPAYTRANISGLCAPQNVQQDKKNMEGILDRWKQRQPEEKPLMVLICTSGGGNRSATFTMNVLQYLDSATRGQLFSQTFLVTGASGGMIGATYFRELYRQKVHGTPINLHDSRYIDHVSEDLLNPTFSSFVTRDIFSPPQYFTVGPYRYIKDRAFSFERELNSNTGGILNNQLKDYIQDEWEAKIPLAVFHSVITRDAKKLYISSQPLRFMMQPAQDTAVALTNEPDAIDYVSFFSRQNPYNLRMLTVMRMNATFPIVLPSVWLPTKPVVDAMDGGLRDNYGVETGLRFLSSMRSWISQNTRGVLLLQIRDREAGGWENPYELQGLADHTIKPILLLQHNWSKMMEYSQTDMFAYFAHDNGFPVYRAVLQYISENEENKAALNFHLTQREKHDIRESLNSPVNAKTFEKIAALMADTAKGKLGN
ncbi:hypothetical protein V9K67_12270 [Paraflavisolibacter sp. H34]|uniref:hypothetical protein n=1 Tax=Huijunlia imazamoxiresistens TaxID=3127457 RepID=UPI003016EE0D